MTQERPAELEEHWLNEYAEVDTACAPPADDARRLEAGGLPAWEENAVRVRLGEKLVLLQQLERAAKSLETLQ